jgi:hypothetical protein
LGAPLTQTFVLYLIKGIFTFAVRLVIGLTTR